MSALDKVKGLFPNLRSEAGKLRTGLRDIRAARDSLIAEREQLVSAPACRADVEHHAHALVDELAAAYPKRLRQALVPFEKRATRAEFSMQDFPQGLLFVLPQPGHDKPVTPADVQAALCYLLNEEVKSGISRALAEQDFSEAGAPGAERRVRIEEIDRELQRLGEEERAILDLLSDVRAAAEDPT